MSVIQQYLAATTEMNRKAIEQWPEAINLQGLADARYCCLEEFVLQHGQPFRSARLAKSIRRGKKGRCYDNTWRFIARNWTQEKSTDFTYVEGIGFNEEDRIGFVHAWAVDLDGNVIDTTWKHHPKTEYFGIPFDWKFVNRMAVKTKVGGLLEPFCGPILLGNWEYVRSARFPNKPFQTLTEMAVAS